MGNDLEDVIEESVTDAVDEGVVESGGQDEGVDTTSEADVAQVEIVDKTPTETEEAVETSEVTSPADKGESDVVEDDFSKKFGISSKSVTGRENRIPYSRVKKIVGKAEAEAERFRKELDEFKPKFTEIETKTRDYEERLGRVAQFENIMENDPKTFLDMLSQIPAYKSFFDYVNQLASGAGGTKEETSKVAVDSNDPMPAPNKEMQDGSKVYDLEGLQALMEWQSKQVEKRVLKQATEQLGKRYEPLEKERERRDYINKVMPVIDKQIAEARTWDKFSELEDKITDLLAKDKNLTLERAYLKAYQSEVIPRLSTDKDKMRTEILEEIRKRPSTTSAPVRVATSKQSEGGRSSLEDIIAGEIAKLK